MEFVSGNVYIRQIPMPKKGMIIHGHTHNFDHTTIIFKGSVHIKAELPNGKIIDKDFKSPSYCLIRAEVKHEITSLEDNTEFWCVYSHRTPKGEVSIEYNGYDEAYR